LPLDPHRVSQVVDIENGERLKPSQRTVSLARISDHYFETLEIPIVLGRSLGTAEIQGKVPGVVVNEAMARRCWPGESPLGKKVTALPYPSAPVIGVARDSRSVQFWEPHRPQLYLPLTEPSTTEMNFLIRTRDNPKPLGISLPEIVHATDRSIPVTVSFMTDVVAQWIWPSQIAAWLAIGTGALAAILAAMGLYGSIAYSINQRTREIGDRMALGAERSTVLRMVVRQGVSLALIGIGAGLAGGFAFGRVLLNFLYGVSPFDPVTFVAVPVLVLLTAVCASYMPARQASKVDPAVALRNE
jgi:putative ABC transport system permease protein